MKTILLLAEAASFHPDQTFSLLRAGLTEFIAPEGERIFFEGSIILQVYPEGVADVGEHHVELRCVPVDGGEPLFSDIEGDFSLSEGARVGNLLWNLKGPFPKSGEYAFVVTLDGKQTGELKVTALNVREKADTSADFKRKE